MSEREAYDGTRQPREETLAREAAGQSELHPLHGRIVKGVSLQNGTTAVPHRLGRIPEGWIVVRKLGASYSYPNEVGRSRDTLSLDFDAVAIVDVWVW